MLNRIRKLNNSKHPINCLPFDSLKQYTLFLPVLSANCVCVYILRLFICMARMVDELILTFVAIPAVEKIENLSTAAVQNTLHGFASGETRGTTVEHS